MGEYIVFLQPGFAASLQLLKVEIGGDSQSTGTVAPLFCSSICRTLPIFIILGMLSIIFCRSLFRVLVILQCSLAKCVVECNASYVLKHFTREQVHRSHAHTSCTLKNALLNSRIICTILFKSLIIKLYFFVTLCTQSMRTKSEHNSYVRPRKGGCLEYSLQRITQYSLRALPGSMMHVLHAYSLVLYVV